MVSFKISNMALLQRQLMFLVFMTVLLIEKDIITLLVNAQLPIQCINFTNLTEYKISRGVIITMIPESLCKGFPGDNGWYRFKYTSLNRFSGTSFDIADSPGSMACPNQTGPLHPCNRYETIRSTFCFEPSVGQLVNITHCGSRYIYQLPKFPCTQNRTRYLVRLNNTGLPSTACNDSINGKLWVGVTARNK